MPAVKDYRIRKFTEYSSKQMRIQPRRVNTYPVLIFIGYFVRFRRRFLIFSAYPSSSGDNKKTLPAPQPLMHKALKLFQIFPIYVFGTNDRAAERNNDQFSKMMYHALRRIRDPKI